MFKTLILSTVFIFLSGCIHSDKNVKSDDNQNNNKTLTSQQAVAGEIKEYKNPMIHGNNLNLFHDNTSYNVGDIITIILEERTNANKKAVTSTSKTSNAGIDAPTIFGLTPAIGGKIASLLGDGTNKGNLSFGLGGTSGFNGDGSSSQSNSLSGEIAVFVVGKFSNGNLQIRGSKTLLINRGEETIVISGIIRPDDISSENTIKSTKVAEADIRYYGGGVVNDSNDMGIVSKFFNKGYGLW